MTQKIVNFLAFVCAMVGVIYYANYEESTKVTDEEAITITQEIVKTQTQLILKDLSIGDDGISNRITIRDIYPDSGYAGWCEASNVTVNGTTTYAQESATIDLYPITYLKGRDEKGSLVSLSPSQRPTKDEFRKEMTETFAHELRHYWQHQTGVYYDHPYDTSIPHDERWAEKDANDYMKKYYKSIQNK